MNIRNKDKAGRRAVLDQEQIEGQDYGATTHGPRQRRGNNFRKLIPLLFITAFGVLIAYQEIPAFADWWERTFFFQTWQVKNTCQQAAIEESSNPDFARVLKPGKVHRTGNGAYIDRLVLGEMGKEGVEQKVEYTCYLDSAGVVVKLNRLE